MPTPSTSRKYVLDGRRESHSAWVSERKRPDWGVSRACLAEGGAGRGSAGEERQGPGCTTAGDAVGPWWRSAPSAPHRGRSGKRPTSGLVTTESSGPRACVPGPAFGSLRCAGGRGDGGRAGTRGRGRTCALQAPAAPPRRKREAGSVALRSGRPSRAGSRQSGEGLT